MNRDEKIKAIQDIKAGIPAHFALNKDKYKYLCRNQTDAFFWTNEGQKVSKEEQEKYLTDSILCINVSKQFHYNEFGKLINTK